MAQVEVVLNVNGEPRNLAIPENRTLLDVIRDDLDLTGAKKACDNGECGSCIVLLGNKPAKACLLEARRAQKKPIVTIEGLASQSIYSDKRPEGEDPTLHPLQQAFLDLGATQCGFCIPGMIMKASSLLTANRNPSRDDVVKSLSNNLCRCTGYSKIIDSVLHAAAQMRGNEPAPVPQPVTGKVIGKSVPRLDSPETVDGRAKYTADLKMEGMLHAKLLRSPHHHARILSIDTSEAAKLPGVHAVITEADVPGTPYLPNCQPQVFLLAKDRVRFRGEAVAAVAADTEEIAELALQKILVEYEPLKAIIELEEGIAPDAPPLFDGLENVSPVKEVIHGDIEKGFAQADIVIENTYSVPVREHGAMEPEAALAYMEDGVMVIKAPLYHPFVQGTASIAANLAMPEDRIRIICPAMGGNFGTRGDTLPAAASALLSIKTGRPVRMVWTRAESILGSCKAPSVIMTYRTGATRDGKIVALDVNIIHGTGSWAPHLIDATTRGAELCYFETLGALLSHVTGPYEIPNVRARARDVLTNAPRFVPLRGTNGNYLPLAYESQVDQLAAKLDIDPLELRLKNCVDVGSMTHIGQVLRESVEIRAELEALRPHYKEAKERISRKQKQNGSPWKSGLGIACGWRNIGYVNIPISAGAELLPDGRVCVMAGTVEQGQGPITQFAQIAADALDVPMSNLVIKIGDTGDAPYPVPTFSSITTVGTGKAVQLACEKLRAAIVEAAAEQLGLGRDKVMIENGEALAVGAPARKLSLAEIANFLTAKKQPLKYESELQWNGEAPNILYGFNAGVVELEVNEQTGQVRLDHVVNVCDPGTVVNPLALEGQMDGGIGFGIGFALKERFHPDLPPTFEAYGLPTTKDAPLRVTRLFAGGPCERGPFGAKSAGEMPGISPIPAIINGIADAIGARVYDIPATPDRVLAAIASRS